MIYEPERFIIKTGSNIKEVFGYRTGMSMKNADTWAFARRYFGRIWFIEGLVPLITAIFVTERALHRTFDRKGNRRQTENV